MVEDLAVQVVSSAAQKRVLRADPPGPREAILACLAVLDNPADTQVPQVLADPVDGVVQAESAAHQAWVDRADWAGPTSSRISALP